MTARWMTRWSRRGLASSPSTLTRLASSVSMYSLMSRLQLLEIDVAGAHYRGRVLVVGQREQQMLERREFLFALVGEASALWRAISRERENDGTCDLTL